MAYRKLGMKSAHRKAMLRNMVTSFLKEERIETTEPRAKELKRVADKIITLGKKGDLHARRQALAYLREEDVVTKLFAEIAPRYAERQGGYTRIIKKGYRRGDAAEIVLVELV
ncbi:MAG: 50S ribosomal protein L17 [Clostridia bacterium]|jgi:large subunit ribosomal protein L17|nr:50S ribosomal protein L17 [Clostridia bacterium]